MIAPREKREPALRPPAALGWVGAVTATLFLLQICHTWFHLAVEPHHRHLPGPAESVATSHAGHTPDDHHGGEGHEPHAVSDHLVQMATKTETSLSGLDLMVAETGCSSPPPPPILPISLPSDWIRPPGESPPDPFQPRAPPLA